MLRLYNSMTGRKEPFRPQRPGEVKMYVCGVTVYDACHLGHARSAVVFDVLWRYLEHKGYRVTYVRNITDIDDKIIQRAREEGVSAEEIARRYTEAYHRDMDALGVRRASVEPKATDHIPEMIALIQALVDKGYAYPVDGDVYFRVRRFPGYGQLSKRPVEEMLAGARVEVDPRKEDPLDFALWKASKPGEPAWESPWGPGRPGWHIECSAMSMKHLGPTLDIHGGGKDLVFPHHENERAQSEAYTGTAFVRYWIHNGFLTLAREKMSKSLGNFFTIRDVLDRFDAEAVRLFLLSTHYRSPVDYTDQNLREAQAALDRVYTLLETLQGLRQSGKDSRGGEETARDSAMRRFLEAARSRFEEALDDDLNTAQALGVVFETVREVNRYLGEAGQRDGGEPPQEVISAVLAFLGDTGRILGLFQRDPAAWFRRTVAGQKEAEARIQALVEERARARARRDWATADRIRRELEEAFHVVLEDRPEGTVWKVKSG